ncbi:MAG: hypothetical protein KBF88_00370 [Polyangiaceae bacterium]|nr:hypothetical protein [Polyangiaceae bacterium]
MGEPSRIQSSSRDSNFNGAERRRNKVYVTRNTEYHLRDGFCVAVRDRKSGTFVDGHLALRRRIQGSIKFHSNGGFYPNPGSPEKGESLYFSHDGRDLVTSPIESIERPAKNIVQSYGRTVPQRSTNLRPLPNKRGVR